METKIKLGLDKPTNPRHFYKMISSESFISLFIDTIYRLHTKHFIRKTTVEKQNISAHVN